MRYHVMVFVIPDPGKVEQVPLVDEEFDSDSGIADLHDATGALISSHRTRIQRVTKNLSTLRSTAVTATRVGHTVRSRSTGDIIYWLDDGTTPVLCTCELEGLHYLPGSGLVGQGGGGTDRSIGICHSCGAYGGGGHGGNCARSR